MPKIIICGSRSIKSSELVKECIKNSGFDITGTICGGAEGVDKIAENWAKENNIPCQVFLPDYSEYDRAAPIIRNIEMLKEGEALIAIWDGFSMGTKHMITRATKMGMPMKVWEVSK
jgi:hypothetical protein